jgi:Predicted membrane protein (DUF2306)
MSALPVHHSASRAAAISSPHQNSLTWLNCAALAWLLLALLGQLIFAAYIVAFYGRAALAGRFEDWNKVMPSGYTPGDTVGNLIIASHLLFTVVIVLGGMLQLMPKVRRVMPAVHRWNGRFYIAAAAILSLGGLAMVWGKGTVGGPPQHIGISLNAVLILIFAGLAWHHARERRIDIHRRWALRLWLAVSGVWFFRIGLMAWIAIHQGPAGFDPKTFQGPFLSFLSFAQYLVPLAVLELYFRAKAHGSTRSRIAVTALLIALTLLTALGIAVATKVMWLPRI